jgi:excisionase family DNA binding protein
VGIIEQIAERLDRLEHELSELRVVPASGSPVWSDGAMRVADAAKFSGISRSELYALMNRGELPWSSTGRNRLVPRKWLVQFLERKQGERVRGAGA